MTEKSSYYDLGRANFFVNDMIVGYIENGKMICFDENMIEPINLAVLEATDIIAEENNYSIKKARNILNKCDLSIITTINPEIQNRIDKLCKSYPVVDNMKTEVSILDIDNKVKAIFSRTHSVNKHQIGSAMKPLGVYAPSLEKKLINFSTMIEDLPISKVKNSNGEYVDFPQNYSQTYHQKPITIAEAVSKSVNTVAVRQLQKLGVSNSISFLQELGFNLEHEKNRIKQSENEVYSSLALGYIHKGLTTIDLAGYYQIFANGGTYSKPTIIDKITTQSGKWEYRNIRKQKRIISQETSVIMNRLLQLVAKNGTAKVASPKTEPIFCKTGTTENKKDNWMVGGNPSYIGAIWCGYEDNKKHYFEINPSTLLFKEIIDDPCLQANNNDFPHSENVIEKPYCTATGEIAGANCKFVESGYYTKDNIPQKCSLHK